MTIKHPKKFQSCNSKTPMGKKPNPGVSFSFNKRLQIDRKTQQQTTSSR